MSSKPTNSNLKNNFIELDLFFILNFGFYVFVLKNYNYLNL